MAAHLTEAYRVTKMEDAVSKGVEYHLVHLTPATAPSLDPPRLVLGFAKFDTVPPFELGKVYTLAIEEAPAT